MLRKVIITSATLLSVMLVNCSSILEDAARSDPGYDTYYRTRTVEQQMADEQNREKIKAHNNSRKNEDEAIKSFNKKAETMGNAQNEQVQDSSSITK
jgi:hypothetical protein